MVATIIGAAAALGSAIASAASSASQNNKARQLIAQQKADNKNWYNARMSEDYTMRPDALAVIDKARTLLGERYANAAATNAVAGGSDASLAMQKASANDALAQTMSDIAASSAARKDAVEQAYRSQDAALTQQQAQSYANQAQATAAAGAQAVNAGLNLMGNDIASRAADTVANNNAGIQATAANPNAAPVGHEVTHATGTDGYATTGNKIPKIK